MRNISVLILSLSLVFAAFVQDADAQLRENLPSIYDLSGPTLKDSGSNKLFGIVDFHMGHSYEMSFSNFGGNTYNQNYYTNTMHLFFNDRLTGRVDLSVAHSPFGNNLMGGQQGPQFFVRNAELNYNITDNSNIRISFQQIPAGSTYYNPYGFGGMNRGYMMHQRRGYHPFYDF